MRVLPKGITAAGLVMEAGHEAHVLAHLTGMVLL
jgi:hypothetical protein